MIPGLVLSAWHGSTPLSGEGARIAKVREKKRRASESPGCSFWMMPADLSQRRPALMR